jgi:aspartate carbamoyltransferase catalytic subunit
VSRAFSKKHFISLQQWTETDFFKIWASAHQFEKSTRRGELSSRGASLEFSNKVIVNLFLEPSTRTRCSFEMAAYRMGISVINMEGRNTLSLSKGESVEDTVRAVLSMNPDVIIVRADSSFEMEKLASEADCPWICAGWGKVSHPSQALLDGFVISKRQADPKKWKILFVGDLRHSRVFSSHCQMAKVLGYEIGVLCPPEFAPERPTLEYGAKLIFFSSLAEGLEWCDFYYALRVQFERHGQGGFDPKLYTQKFQLKAADLLFFRGKKFLMHPGPINWGVELHQDLLQDVSEVFSSSTSGGYSLVAEQVASGVWVRQAILAAALSEVR